MSFVYLFFDLLVVCFNLGDLGVVVGLDCVCCSDCCVDCFELFWVCGVVCFLFYGYIWRS